MLRNWKHYIDTQTLIFSRRASHRILTGLLATVVFALFLSGCTFWRNFTTYFNVLYLAQLHMDAYEAQMNANTQTAKPEGFPMHATTAQQAVQAHRWLDEEYETRQMALRTGPAPRIDASFLRNQPTAKGVGSSVHLDSAIILGSKILADKRDTKYLEDALFIVGKAQFYKNDFSGAKRKFLELLTHYPNTKYGSAVQMFLARSMIASNGFDTALVALNAAVRMARAENDLHTLGDAHRTLAEIIYAKNADSLKAIAEELDSAESYYHGDEAAHLAYEAGIVNYLSGDWPDASADFERAVAKSSEANFEGEARIEHALAERRMGKFQDATKELTFVSEKSKFSLEWPAAKYEFAYTGDLAARAAVNDDLRSDTYRTQYYPGVENGYYVVDTTFAKQSQSIVSHSKFREAEILRGMGEYDSASHYALPLIGTKDFSNGTMNDYVSERMRSLAKFASWRNELIRLDSVGHKVKLVRQGIDMKQHEDASIHQEAVRQVLGPRFSSGAPPTLTVDEEKEVSALEARLKKEKSGQNILSNLTAADTTKFLDSIHYRMAYDHYNLGLAYENFRELPVARQEYQTALAFQPVLRDTAVDLFHAEVLFTWLQLEAGEKNTATRDSLMVLLAKDFGNTIYARQAMTLYGGPRDTNSPGEVAYRVAYTTLRSSGLDASKSQFLGVAANYIHEDVAPRSLFAVGTTYEEAEKYDSALYYYKRVLIEYPYSPYADALRPRLAEAGFVQRPQQTARRVEPEIKSDAEKEQQQAERARFERQQELLRQQQQNPRLMVPRNQSSGDSSGNPAGEGLGGNGAPGDDPNHLPALSPHGGHTPPPPPVVPPPVILKK